MNDRAGQQTSDNKDQSAEAALKWDVRRGEGLRRIDGLFAGTRLIQAAKPGVNLHKLAQEHNAAVESALAATPDKPCTCVRMEFESHKAGCPAARPDKPSASEAIEQAVDKIFDFLENDEHHHGIYIGGRYSRDKFREIVSSAIQAARTAPSEDQLDEAWDRGYNAAEERYQKQLAAPSDDTKRPGGMLSDIGALLQYIDKGDMRGTQTSIYEIRERYVAVYNAYFGDQSTQL